MSKDAEKRRRHQRLLQAALLEMLCLAAGAIAWAATGKWVWLVIGVIAGLGFSLPAVIRHVRESKEQDRASR